MIPGIIQVVLIAHIFFPRFVKMQKSILILQREKLKLCTIQVDKFVNFVNESTFTCVFS